MAYLTLLQWDISQGFATLGGVGVALLASLGMYVLIGLLVIRNEASFYEEAAYDAQLNELLECLVDFASQSGYRVPIERFDEHDHLWRRDLLPQLGTEGPRLHVTAVLDGQGGSLIIVTARNPTPETIAVTQDLLAFFGRTFEPAREPE